MAKVISFSLWGNDPVYVVGAVKNAILAKQYYPGWECWFYCGRSVPEYAIKELERLQCKVIRMEDPGNWEGMFWRFLPCSNKDVQVVLSRDVDSRLGRREVEAVNQWLDSDKQFHIMRDHPWHTTVILGGMWGCKNPLLWEMEHFINRYKKGSFWQVDQNFLKEIIYPMVKDVSMVHDEFFEKKPFPSKRVGHNFVGQAFDPFDNPLHPEHMDMLL